MNHNTNILIDHGPNLEEIVDLIGSFLGVIFEINLEVESQIYRVRYRNETVQVYDDHGLEDDCGIEFSKYEFIVTFDSIVTRYNESKVTQSRQHLCFKIAEFLREKIPCNTLVIEDLQLILMSNEKLLNHDQKSLKIYVE